MGTVERWIKTLKEMLCKNIQDHGNDWEIRLPHLLFAYREVPHAGPDERFLDGGKKYPTSCFKILVLENLRQNLERAHEMATGNAEKNQAEYNGRYNFRAREKKFHIGEKVLILESVSPHKLLKNGSDR
ncbi:hypothetical protein AVEN_183969-1 [Araneus ventricosus]|uniref:Integrase catalytic domain-containing protein n=1 Tax=Araneus ventricosus TaxID=182803 RepID=A0A4Y2E3X5_ARAVE|nr:hypothetical protein AVEN_183969-1 [Araneus ventricosus]